MPEQQAINIVILGGGSAGWMAANLMVKAWPKDKVRITLIESPDIGIIGVGEGSTPSLKRFFDLIEIDEQQWMSRAKATYKLNITFHGWSPQKGPESYGHPFISQLDTFTQRAFMVNCRTRRLGLDTHTQPEDFLLNGVLAGKGKGPLTPDNFPFRMEYGYHFDSGLLGEFLQEVAIGRGINHVRDKVLKVHHHDSGDIAALACQSGALIQGDFFIDCSGFASLLMQQSLNVPFDSFADNLFNDAAVVMPTEGLSTLPVETRATALRHGWCWQIPLRDRTGNGYVYSSDFTSKEAAARELCQHLGLAEGAEQDCRHLPMRVGQLRRHWANNCVGLGLSQGFIEPLEATALHLVQVSVQLFIATFEKGGFGPQYRDEFNHKMHLRFERVRDYIVAHYKLNSRNDSEYWRANRNNTKLSDSLCHILDVWYKRGDLEQEIARQQLDTHFGALSWHCLLSGYGAFPGLAPNQPGQGDLYREQDVAGFLQGCALNFSSHQACLNLRSAAVNQYIKRKD